MKYILTGEENWADEFDVHFFEVLDERDKAIYDSANKILESWVGYYGFGTNEYFDDFEFLGRELIPITDDEYEVMKAGERFYGNYSKNKKSALKYRSDYQCRKNNQCIIQKNYRLIKKKLESA